MASRPCGERQTSPWDAATEITSLMGLAAASRSRLTSRPGYASGGGSFVCPLRWEHREPTSIDDLEQMDTAQLRALVARGRQRRLALVKANQERDPEADSASTSMPLPMPEGG
jgi:hypothetical protein